MTSHRKMVDSKNSGNMPQTPDLSGALTQQWIDMQRIQCEALFAWQDALARMYQDLWDQWVCRFGGGAPIGD